MTSLGQTLAKNIAIERSNTVPPAVLAEQKRQARIREVNEAGTRFFAKAKQYFTDGILAATPIDSLQLQVGGRGYKEAVDYHDEIHRDMDWYDKDGHRFYCKGGEVPTSMTDPDRFAASWEDFKSWAAANDLEPYWKLGAAYGPSSWWFLRVKPVTPCAQANA